MKFGIFDLNFRIFPKIRGSKLLWRCGVQAHGSALKVWKCAECLQLRGRPWKCEKVPGNVYKCAQGHGSLHRSARVQL